MSVLIPGTMTVSDVCKAALKWSGALGIGQSPLAEDMTDAWGALQVMLQQWERKRYLVYHLVTKLVTSTGAQTYTVGPGGNIDTLPPGSSYSSDFSNDFGQTGPSTINQSVRPDKIESAFLRQLTQSQPNQIDYPMELLQSMEDYNRIALKQLVSFPGAVFYDPAWPLGVLYPWPVPQASIYAVGITIKEQLPVSFGAFGTVINLPLEYTGAMIYNLALRLQPKYGLRPAPGDPLPQMAKDALQVLRGANTAIARLQMPKELIRPGLYNIFSDRSY